MTSSFEQFLKEADRMPIVSTKGSKIVEFFNGKTVLVTGATGFLGKLLVEKILRVCPKVDRVYVLVRIKKNEDGLARIDKLCNGSLFGPLRKLRPTFQHKISIIKGDISLPDLGLSLEDRQVIIEKMNVIFHVAATINFHEELSVASAINLRGTSAMLAIAEKCKFLDSFVYVSTIFSNCYKQEIKERFYAIPVNPRKIIDSIDDKATLDSITKHLVDKWPNTYLFSKAVTENLVKEYEGKLAICVVRPAIIISTYKEPLKSWNDNFSGATGFLLGTYKGLIQSIYGHGEKAIEAVPADYVTNCMIAAAYKTALEKQNVISIYNYVSSVENKLTYNEFHNESLKYRDEVPVMKSYWYNNMAFTRYKAIHFLWVFLLHFFPALIMDMLRVLSGKKPRMVSTCKIIMKVENAFEVFLTSEWKFENGNTRNLWNFLGEEDQRIFPFSMNKLDWADYHRTHLMGLRTYVLKEDPKNITQARKRWNRLYVSHVVAKLMFKCLVIYMALFALTKIYY